MLLLLLGNKLANWLLQCDQAQPCSYCACTITYFLVIHDMC